MGLSQANRPVTYFREAASYPSNQSKPRWCTPSSASVPCCASPSGQNSSHPNSLRWPGEMGFNPQHWLTFPALSPRPKARVNCTKGAAFSSIFLGLGARLTKRNPRGDKRTRLRLEVQGAGHPGNLHGALAQGVVSRTGHGGLFPQKKTKGVDP